MTSIRLCVYLDCSRPSEKEKDPVVVYDNAVLSDYHPEQDTSLESLSFGIVSAMVEIESQSCFAVLNLKNRINQLAAFLYEIHEITESLPVRWKITHGLGWPDEIYSHVMKERDLDKIVALARIVEVLPEDYLAYLSLKGYQAATPEAFKAALLQVYDSYEKIARASLDLPCNGLSGLSAMILGLLAPEQWERLGIEAAKKMAEESHCLVVERKGKIYTFRK